jgi:hypothetical protein
LLCALALLEIFKVAVARLKISQSKIDLRMIAPSSNVLNYSIAMAFLDCGIGSASAIQSI